ncbi:MAG: hypothetical protein KDC98_17090 [Planctomycetes bacterium]|nr:hypothetical protein [Planctomycetota bacterium]
MASDSWRGAVILFGGGGAFQGNTMMWDGLVWSQAAPSGSGPNARSFHDMVYDPVRRKIVLFGGLSSGSPLGDTWEWDSGTWNGSAWSAGSWTQLTPVSSPSPRWKHSMAWDTKNQRVILFAGVNSGTTAFRDMWSWDGLDWTQSGLPATSLPPGRIDAAMAGDPLHETIVLAGGTLGTGGALGDTWEWDGSAWTQLNTPLPGGSLKGKRMVFDHNAGRVLLYPYQPEETQFLANGTWHPYANSGAFHFIPSSYPVMAFDHVSSRSMIYGDSFQIRHLAWESCCTDAEMPVDPTGLPAYPPDVDPSTIVDDPTFEQNHGLVSALYPQLNTSLDNWHSQLPCNPSIGGEVPATASNPPWLNNPCTYVSNDPQQPIPGLELDSSTPGQEQAEAQALLNAMCGFSSQQIVSQLEAFEDQILQDVSLAPPLLVTNPAALAPVTGAHYSVPDRCVDANDDYVFGGQDIVFIHGLRMDPLFDALVGTPNGPIASAGWTLPSTIPGNGNNPEFYANGYWKAGAEAYWHDHIKRFLTDKGKKNRYLIVAWPSTQRLEIGVQAILTQIGDAMTGGTGVVDPLHPTGPAPTNFGRPGFVIVSHSTGGPISDVAMERAASINTGQAAFIAEHCTAHVALHGAFEGSRMATAVIAAAAYANQNLPSWVCPLAKFGVFALNQTTNINTYPISCPFNFSVAWNSVLVDLVPSVMKTRWGPKMDSTPIQVLTVGGGHPSYLAPFKFSLHLGFDDGVVNMNSQFANPDSVTVGPFHFPSNPSGYRPDPFGLLQSKVFDMGVRRTDPFRAAGFYFDQVLDPHLNPLFLLQHPFGVASSPVAWLSPTGMNQPVGKIFDPQFDPRSYRPKHYSLLLSTADHFADMGASRYDDPVTENGWPAASTGLRDNYRPTFGEVNCEEVSVRRNPELYVPFANAAYPSLSQPLLSGPPPVVQITKGRLITFKRINRWLPPGWRIAPFWLWRRDYTLVDQYKQKHECDYVYDWVLPQRMFDCPMSPAVCNTFGLGCLGSSGVLTATPVGLPQLGSSMQVVLSNMNSLSIGFVGIGLSQIPPFDLAALGMPGCYWYLNHLATVFVIGSGGTASFVQPIPNSPAFVGLPLRFQGIGFDPVTNTLGWITSNGIACTVGV